MKTAKLNNEIGEKQDCTKRITKNIKGCVQLSSKYTFFADIWLSVVNIVQQASAELLYYYGTAKTSHKVFCIAALEKLIKECLGGSYIVVNISPIVPVDIPLINIGYKHNYRKLLGFISDEGAGSTDPSYPYLYFPH